MSPVADTAVHAHALDVERGCYEREAELVGYVAAGVRVDRLAVAEDPDTGALWLFTSATDPELLGWSLCGPGECDGAGSVADIRSCEAR